MKEKMLRESRISSIQSVIDLYKKDIDRTLVRENLKLTVEQRLRNELHRIHQRASHSRRKV